MSDWEDHDLDYEGHRFRRELGLTPRDRPSEALPIHTQLGDLNYDDPGGETWAAYRAERDALAQSLANTHPRVELGDAGKARTRALVESGATFIPGDPNWVDFGEVDWPEDTSGARREFRHSTTAPDE